MDRRAKYEIAWPNVIRIDHENRPRPSLFNEDDKRRRLVITLRMTKLVQHIWEEIRFANALTLEPMFDTERSIRSKGDVLSWLPNKSASAQTFIEPPRGSELTRSNNTCSGSQVIFDLSNAGQA